LKLGGPYWSRHASFFEAWWSLPGPPRFIFEKQKKSLVGLLGPPRFIFEAWWGLPASLLKHGGACWGGHALERPKSQLCRPATLKTMCKAEISRQIDAFSRVGALISLHLATKVEILK